MQARSTILGLIAGLGLFFLGESALAQCCAPPTPPCCTPPPPPCCAPPPPPPPSVTPCCTPGHNVNIPGVNVFVAPTVVVNASASARASAGASGGAAAIFYGGGSNSGYYSPPMAMGSVALNVEGRKKRTAYQSTRTRRVVIRAVCIDTRQTPHPASQVFAGQDVADGYEGELYRCLAGTTMQVTWAEYLGKVDFSGGQTIACGKSEALYRAASGKLECRRQKAARDCNERSLLRRFGAGVKILTIVETFTAYREEEESMAATTMSLDGGVGGVAY